MFFIFSKILFFLLNPLIWILVCLLLAFVFKKKARLLKFFLVGAILLLLFFSNKATYNFFAKKWEVPAVAVQHVKGNYKYAVVLGGMSSVDPVSKKLLISEAIDRILVAIQLYHKGQVNKIVITGGSGLLLDKKAKEAPFLEQFCIQLKVAEEDIIIEKESRNTFENAVFTKKIIGVPEQKILLITSASHMPRSIGCFKKQGFRFDYLAANPSVDPTLYIDDFLLPKAEALIRWNNLFKEWVGYISYKAAGYI